MAAAPIFALSSLRWFHVCRFHRTGPEAYLHPRAVRHHGNDGCRHHRGCAIGQITDLDMSISKVMTTVQQSVRLARTILDEAMRLQ